MDKALRQAALALVTFSAVALTLSGGIVGNTYALFNGETQNAGSSFAGGWIDPPSAVTATASGYDVSFSWTPGTHGPVMGQQLWGVDNGVLATGSTCSGSGVSLLSPTPALTRTTAATIDSNRGLTINGHWFCYQLISTSATNWTAQVNNVLQVGLATTGMALANGSTNNSLDPGDTITLTFNQQTNLASGTTKVCVITPGTIIVGDTAGGSSCSSGDGYNVGLITGEALGHNQVYRNSTYVTSSSAPWTMTITIVGGGSATYSGTATFTPSASILSAATTHQASLCITAASTCLPSTTTHF